MPWGGALLLWSGYGASREPVPPTTPFIGFDPPTLELGEQLWGAAVPFEFIFVNEGSEPMAITRVRRSCDCTVLDQQGLEGVSIGPGESLPITGFLESGVSPGDLTRVILLEFANGQKHQATLSLRVISGYQLSADSLRFDVTDGEMPQTKEVLLIGAETAIVAAPQAAVDWISARNDGKLVSVTVDPAAVRGRRSFGTVTILTDDPQVPSAGITVEVNRFSEINFYPPRLFLLRGRTGSLRVTDAIGNAVEISGARSAPPGLALKFEANGRLDVDSA